MTKDELIQFEEEIKGIYLAGKIKAPIHLSVGSEEPLIGIFKDVKPEDWVLSTHRSHYHALLKGVPPDLVKAEILAGRSIHLNFKEYNFLASAIVGGIAPIAVGVAMAMKMRGEKRKAWCFLGDMAFEMGIVYESIKYARNHNLPVCFVVEDNGLSTNTPTRLVWGIKDDPVEGIVELERWETGKIIRYVYQRRFPHSGAGQFVRF